LNLLTLFLGQSGIAMQFHQVHTNKIQARV
jgi:hypothetical protein